MTAPNHMKARSSPQEREKTMGDLLDVHENPASTGFPNSMLVIFFSVPKVGKSTAASSFPKPLFIDIDDGLDRLTVKRAGDRALKTWEEVDLLGYQLARNPDHGYKTLVIDTANGLYRLCEDEMCQRLGISAIGQDKKVLSAKGLGFGEDWNLVRRLFFQTIAKFHSLGRKQGFHIVLTGHAKPDALESKNRTVDIPGAGARELMSKVELICYLKSDRRTDENGRAYPVRLLSFSSISGIQECGSRFPEMDGLDDIVIEDGAYNTIRRTWDKRADEIGTPATPVPDPTPTSEAPDPEPESPAEPQPDTEPDPSAEDIDDDEFGVPTSSSKSPDPDPPVKPPIVEGEGRQRDADFRPDSERIAEHSERTRQFPHLDALDNEYLVNVNDPKHLEVIIQQICSICNNARITKEKFLSGIKRNFNLTEDDFMSWSRDDSKANDMGIRAIASAIKLALLNSIKTLDRWSEDEMNGWLLAWEDHTDFEN